MKFPWLRTAREVLGALVSAVLRVLLLAVGALLGLAALALGLVLTLSLLAWALLRGRKPALSARAFRWRGGAARGRDGPPAEVVDVEAREVRDVHPGHDGAPRALGER